MSMTLDEALRHTAEAVRATDAERAAADAAQERVKALVAARLPGAYPAYVTYGLKPPESSPIDKRYLVIVVPGAGNLEGDALLAHFRGALAHLVGVRPEEVGPDATQWQYQEPGSGILFVALIGRVNPNEGGNGTYDVLVGARLSRFRLGLLARSYDETARFFGADCEHLCLLIDAMILRATSVGSGTLAQTRWWGERPTALSHLLPWVLQRMADTVLEGSATHLFPEVAADVRKELGQDHRQRIASLVHAASECVLFASRLEERGRLAEAHAALHDLFGAVYPIPPPAEWVIRLHLDAIGEGPGDIPGTPHPMQGFGLGGSRPQSGHLDEESWRRLGDAVFFAAQRTRSAAREHAVTRVVVAGHAPHAAFAHAGLTLSRWCGRQTLALPPRLNHGQWDLLDLSRPVDPEGPLFLDATRGLNRLEPSIATGRLAIFVGMGSHSVPAPAIEDFFAERGEPMIALVELGTTQTVLDEHNAPSAALEIRDALRRLRAIYPRAYGLALFIAGPAPLGFIVGRSIDPDVFVDVWTTQYTDGRYDLALELPWAGPPLPEERVQVSALSLVGYRGLGELSLDLDSRLTVLIGVNGSGKTSVLNALAVLLGQLFDALPPEPTRRQWALGDITVSEGRLTGLVTLNIGRDELTLRQSRDLDRQSESNGAAETVGRWRARVQAEPEEACLPIAVYYTTERSHSVSTERAREPSSDPPWQLRLEAYRGALAGRQAGFDSFFSWYKEREDLENAERARNPQYRDRPLAAVRRAISELVPGFHSPRIERRPLRFCIDKGQTTLSGDQLSAGERGMIALAGDLARRLAEANPGRSDPLQGPGVVLIDEVDLHLHPGWQRSILPGLLAAFPGCQFVVTSHSPQVLGHVEARQVRILRRVEGRVEVSMPDGAYGLDANRLLEDVFDVPKQADEIERRIRALYDFIEAGRMDEASALYDKLVARIGVPDYPELVRARIWLERMRHAKA